MSEWFNETVLKTVVGATPPGVRIPLCPPVSTQHLLDFIFTPVPARIPGTLLFIFQYVYK